MYNHITVALKDSHPRSYLSDHQRVHTFFVNEFGNLVSATNTVVNSIEEPEELLADYGVTFI